MFDKILIANRGEIACRVIKTAQRMGIKTVAVYSDADARALHVDMADEAVNIGPAAAAQSYLVIDKIIEACKETGAQAVHPGYGFLSENAAFAHALKKAGLVFIGPNPRAIGVMGDKIESKKFANAANVSTVPGYLGEIGDDVEAVKIAGEIGYPVMIKASAGGGGKGMRIAHSAAEVAEGFMLAKSEAKSSFGDDRVFIEKFIVNPRHVEIQVIGDKHGNVVHLGERECSIQRRNQKVIEEAPSPLLDAKTRKAMGEQAVALARAVDYDSAGTVEFVAGQDRSFFFLEMNTRRQGEHPVTELVTGIDLVEQMIRSAVGDKLAIKQKDVKLNGWAIESRIYAEDPYRNFMPSTGRLVSYRPPDEVAEAGASVRNDTGVYEGGEISIFYDPMIAKLCTHGKTRDDAIDQMADALDRFFIDGIQHNVPFLAAIMANDRWRSGELATSFIDDEFPGGFTGAEAGDEVKRVLVSAAAVLDHTENARKRQISGQMGGKPVSFNVERIVKLGDDWFDVTMGVTSDNGDTVTLQHGGDQKPMQVENNWVPGEPVWQGTIGGRPVSVQVRRILNGFRLSHRGVETEAHVYTRREAELARLMPVKLAPDTSKKLLCPMPGLMVSLAVASGQEIKAGEQLCVVEAMKMENILRAERDGTVSVIHAAPGDSLAVDAVIMEFE
ncbi:MAG: acetyl-CoA carboxylase biotin carboxylase subunit [Aestuariivirgaceae bacterium]